MTVARALLPAVTLIVTAVTAYPASPDHGLKLPPDFIVTEYAGPDLANDVYTLHISREGRVMVAGRGYVRELVDPDADGKADRAVELVTGLRDGPMGLLSEGEVLYLVADGGLKRYRLRQGQPAAAETAELVLAVKTGGEHDAHAVRRGPDGWLYLLCGNMAGVSAKTVTSAASPVRNPVAGCLVRIHPDGKAVEVVADGFRNPYHFDFNAAGDAFTYDSDNERCVGLPWYESTRFYHVVPGGHHGWLSPQVAQTWRRPPYFWDVVPPVTTTGRGSPTGVCFYNHPSFPARYRGGFFLADWTFGRVVFVRPRAVGGGYTGTAEPFAQAVGDAGFAPTGLAVHPASGDLYVSTGGRGTRGAVYWIRPAASSPSQPTTSPGQEASVLRALVTAEREADALGQKRIADLVRSHVSSEDRLVRQVVARLAARLPTAVLNDIRNAATSDSGRLTLGFALAAASPAEARRTALAVLTSAAERPAVRLAAVRLLQISLGDLTDPKAVGGAFEGYTPRRPVERPVAREAAAVLRSVYPTGHHDLDRELTRTLAVLADDDPATVAAVAADLTATSEPVDDFHTLLVLSRLQGRRTAGQTRAIVDALLRLDEKADAKAIHRERHWPLRLAEVAKALAERDAGLTSALTGSPRFGRPGHVVFAHIPGVDRAAAARRFLERAAADPDYGWLPDHIPLLGELPPQEVRNTLTTLWERGGLEDALIPLVARSPVAADRDKYLAALRSSRPGTVAAAAKALRELPAGEGGKELVTLVRSLRQLQPTESNARNQIAKTLRLRTGADLGADAKLWVEWATRHRPDVAKELSADAEGVAGTRKRLAGIDWSVGDAAAGRKVFAKAACVACHNGAQAVGPSLEGVTSRFSRDDLVTAVIDPNRDVPPRYRATKVTTDDGKVYHGVVIYEANDGLILQTGATETVRVAGRLVEAKQQLDTSLMPGGLLDPLTDREVADLFAYLKSLSQPAAKPDRTPGK